MSYLNSTETALLRVKNDIASAIDNIRMQFFGHAWFISCVWYDCSRNFGRQAWVILSTSLEWFATYLKNRKYRVCISGDFLTEHVMNFGLPQWSILGSNGYTMYTQPIGDTLRMKMLIFILFYADDIQIYVSFDPRIPGEGEQSLNRLRLSWKFICVGINHDFDLTFDPNTKFIPSLESTRQLSGQRSKRSMPDSASYITHSLMKDGVPSENSEGGINFVFGSKVLKIKSI